MLRPLAVHARTWGSGNRASIHPYCFSVQFLAAVCGRAWALDEHAFIAPYGMRMLQSAHASASSNQHIAIHPSSSTRPLPCLHEACDVDVHA